MNPEKFRFRKTEIPRGLGDKLNEALENAVRIFEKVKNKVVLINPEVYFPLKLEVGKESPLGLFAKATFEGMPLKPGEMKIEVWPPHARSSLLGRIIFKDKQGRLYRDIDLKGAGWLFAKKPFESLTEYTLRQRTPWGRVLGLLGNKDAFKDYKRTEEFLSKGIRTARTLAIIKLEEIFVEGKKVSLEKAKKLGLTKKRYGRFRIGDIQPVIEVRGFGTKARIEDAITIEWSKRMRDLFLTDAKKLVSQETGQDVSDNRKYLEWLTATLGKNVGLINKEGWWHINISHDITLDGRILGFDILKKLRFNWQRKRDVSQAKESLRELVDGLGFGGEWNKYQKQFEESYQKAFQEK